MDHVVVGTRRLVVRRFRLDDLDAFHAYRNDPDVARWQGWDVPYARSRAEALVREMVAIELFRAGAWTQLAIERRDEPGLIGDVGVRVDADEPTAELGITLARSAQGRGYASEALGALVDHLLGPLGLTTVIAVTATENDAARRLVERVGLRAVATDGEERTFSRSARPPGP